MTSLLQVPYLGTAEEDVQLTEWLVAEGQDFEKGQTLAVVETLKASFEVEAEAAGTLLRHLANEGTRVRTNAPLGVVGARGEAVDEAELAKLLEVGAEPSPEVEEDTAAPAPREGEPPTAGSGKTYAAPSARRIARELGVDLGSVKGTGRSGLILRADVEAAAAAGTGASGEGAGRVEAEFLAHVRREGEAFAALSSDFKIALYRRHGAAIGRDAVLGPGAVILAEHLVLGDGAHIGAGVRIEASRFEAGPLLHVGARSAFRCRSVLLGENAFFAEDVEVGGGGAMDPEAELVVGSHGFVGEHVHLNPCRPLRLGDEVVISRNAVIMTHSFGGSTLQGYPNRFAGVSIGDGSQVGIGATLFPGVEMGAGSILLSGSSLVSSVPSGRLYGGVPATDLKAAARPLGPAELVERAREVVREFARQLSLRGHGVETEETDGQLVISVSCENVVHRLRFAAELPGPSGETVAEELVVGARASEEAWSDAPPELVAIDLSVPRIKGVQGPLSDAFREFLRKRGVRLHPRTWTYPGGWL